MHYLAIVFIFLSNCLYPATSTAFAQNIPTVELCDLTASPGLYNGKEIRLHGTYSVCKRNNYEFDSSSCDISKSIWVEISPYLKLCSNPKAVQTLIEITDKSGARLKNNNSSIVTLNFQRADVELIGRFIASNPYQQPDPPKLGPFRLIDNRNLYDFIFYVSCVEKVEPLQ